MNSITLIGNVGNQPEIKILTDDKKVASFSLATTEKFKTKTGELKEQTEWHKVVCYRAASVIERFVNKGDKIAIKGKIHYDKYTNKEGEVKYFTQIIANEVELLGSRSNNIQKDSDDLPL